MIRIETAKELVRWEENLAIVLRLIKSAEEGIEICVGNGENDEDNYIFPTKELILPFLEQCRKFVLAQIEDLNNKVREELNDVTQTN
jgi:hypothetical protein